MENVLSTIPTHNSSVVYPGQELSNSACIRLKWSQSLRLRCKIFCQVLPSDMKEVLTYVVVVARLGNLYVLSPGKPFGRSKQKISNPKSGPTCRGLRGGQIQRNRTRSPGGSGGLRISRVFREGELVHRQRVMSCWICQRLGLSALKGL